MIEIDAKTAMMLEEQLLPRCAVSCCGSDPRLSWKQRAVIIKAHDALNRAKREISAELGRAEKELISRLVYDHERDLVVVKEVKDGSKAG